MFDLTGDTDGTASRRDRYYTRCVADRSAAVGAVQSAVVIRSNLSQMLKAVRASLQFREGAASLAAICGSMVVGCMFEYLESGLPLDLLFTNVVMPGEMTGRQLGDEVARRRGKGALHFRIYRKCSHAPRRLDLGATLLSKPYGKSELARMVRLALRDAADSRQWSIPLADKSILVPMGRQPASSRALSSS
jgi:hypothetical protein